MAIAIMFIFLLALCLLAPFFGSDSRRREPDQHRGVPRTYRAL